MEQKNARNKVVAHFVDGRLLKGYTHDFTPIRDTFHLTSQLEEDFGTTYEVNVTELKAIFFVRTFKGNVGYKEKKRYEDVDSSRLRGMRIRVEFVDGEVIRGISLGYSKTKKGFFVVPVDPMSNNERVYVVAASVRDVKIAAAASL